MPVPKDHLAGTDGHLALQDHIRRMTELASPLASLDRRARELAFGPTSMISESLRQVTDGLKSSKDQLDLIRQAAAINRSLEMPQTVRDILRQADPYAEHLNALRQAEPLGLSASARLLLESRHSYAEHFGAVKLATEMQAFAPAREALNRAFGGAYAYTDLLDSVRKATVFVEESPIQQELRRAVAGLPHWLKPVEISDTLLRSWKTTAEIGLIGAARPGLIHDVIGVLHRERPDTFAFDVAVQFAEGLDLDENLREEWALELLRRYSAALVERLATTKDWIARQGIITILTFCGMIFSLYYTREAAIDGHLSRLATEEQTALARAAASAEPTLAHKEIVEHFKVLEKLIQEQNDDQRSDRNIRVVIQSAPLRVEPNAKASVIRVVYPDDRVRVQDVKNSWALVEVFEYKSEASVIGWINRRNLRMPSRIQ